MTSKKTPLRTCVSCRVQHPQSHLYRFICDNEKVQMDNGSRNGGRGAYVCQATSCLDVAINSDRLERALKSKISIQSKTDLARLILEG
mgnify:CR=1 FL=1